MFLEHQPCSTTFNQNFKVLFVVGPFSKKFPLRTNTNIQTGISATTGTAHQQNTASPVNRTAEVELTQKLKKKKKKKKAAQRLAENLFVFFFLLFLRHTHHYGDLSKVHKH